MIEALSNEALALAEKHQVRAYQAMIYIWRAFRDNRSYDIHTGLEWAAKGLALCKEVQNPEGTGDSLRVIGMMYHQIGEAQKAIEKFTEAVPHYKTINDWSGVIVCAAGESTAYTFLGDYISATRVLRDLEAMMNEHGLTIRKAQIYALLGFIAYLEGHYEQSLAHLEEARGYSDYVGISFSGTLAPMSYQAGTLIALQRYDEADALLHSACGRRISPLSNACQSLLVCGAKTLC